jgi:hypothetical protein
VIALHLVDFLLNVVLSPVFACLQLFGFMTVLSKDWSPVVTMITCELNVLE